MLALEGCIVTIDAMGTHANIAQMIVDKGADYVLALKGNQGQMEEDVQALFADADGSAYAGIAHHYSRDVDGGHGRIEIRETWAITDPSHLSYVDPTGTWPELRSLVMVRAQRRIGNKISVERRYYLSSLDTSATEIGAAVRDHWGIENSVHWVLDLAFRQDEGVPVFATPRVTSPPFTILPQSPASGDNLPRRPPSQTSQSRLGPCLH
jgi:predicted transposase YbfD/YdcC